MKRIKILLLLLGGFILLIVLSLPFFIRPLNRTPYQQTAYYSQMMGSLDSLAKKNPAVDTLSPLLACMNKVNITLLYSLVLADGASDILENHLPENTIV